MQSNRIFISLVLLTFASTIGLILTNQKAESPKPKSIWDRTAQEVREIIDTKIMAVEAETPQVFSVENKRIPWKDVGLPVRIYIPDNMRMQTRKKNPLVLMIHGGAFVAGSLDTHDAMARYLSRGAQAVVVSVGYTKAPEAKFPIQLEQAYAALEWAIENAKLIHADPKRLAIIGDSAGGNIAAALCIMIRDRKGPKISLQVLINPAPDLTGKGRLERRDDADDFMRWQSLHYVAEPEDVYNPLVSPVLAENLNGLPPAVVILAEKDALKEDGQKYADRLKAAGVPITVYTQLGVDHLAGKGARAAKEAQESLDVAVSALKSSLQ